MPATLIALLLATGLPSVPARAEAPHQVMIPRRHRLTDAKPPVDEKAKEEAEKKKAAESIPCLQAICGTVKEAKPFLRTYLVKSNAVLAKPLLSFPPALAKLVDAAVKANDALIALLTQQAKTTVEAPPFTPGQNKKAIFNYLAMTMAAMKAEYESAVEDGRAVVKLKEAETRQKLASLKREDQDYLIKCLRFWLKHSADSQEGLIKALPPVSWLKNQHPGKDVTEAFAAEITEAREHFRRLREGDPFRRQIFAMMMDESRIDAAEAYFHDRTISEDQMRAVFLINNQFQAYAPILDDSKDNPFNERAVPSSREILKALGGAAKVRESVKKYFDGIRLAPQTSSCLAQYHLNQELLPTGDEIARLKQDARQAKAAIASRLLPLYSEQTRKMLQGKLDAIEFNYPPTKADLDARLQRHFRALRKEHEGQLAALKGMSQEDRRDLALFTVYAATTFADLPEEDRGTDRVLCGDFEFSPMSDASYTGLGAINLSYTTATGPASPRQMTILHEIGHALSGPLRAKQGSEISFRRFTGSRACLANQHREPLPPETKKASAAPDAEGPYNEEDYADAVAGFVGSKEWSSNPWCQFLQTSDDNEQYYGGALAAQDFDVHSSGLFRLLHFQHQLKGELPKLCVDYLAKAGGAPEFKACLGKVD